MQRDYYANFLNTDKATADKAEKCIKYKKFSETSNTIIRKKKDYSQYALKVKYN